MKNLVICLLAFALCTVAVLDTREPQLAVNVAKDVLPSVVEITVMKPVTFTFRDTTIKKWIPDGSGSGVIVGNGQYVATCYHVVKNAERILLRIQDEVFSYDATEVITRPEADLAILRIESTRIFKAADMSMRNLKIGERIYCVGNGFGKGSAFSEGLISRTYAEQYDSFQHTAVANLGNSGGGVFDTDGKLIGITWGIYSINTPPSYLGMSFAFPISRVNALLPEADKTWQFINTPAK